MKMSSGSSSNSSTSSTYDVQNRLWSAKGVKGSIDCQPGQHRQNFQSSQGSAEFSSGVSEQASTFDTTLGKAKKGALSTRGGAKRGGRRGSGDVSVVEEKRVRNPNWGRDYEYKRKSLQKRGHATNLRRYHRELLSPHHFKHIHCLYTTHVNPAAGTDTTSTTLMESYPGALDTILAALRHIQPSPESSTINRFTMGAYDQAVQRVETDRGTRVKETPASSSSSSSVSGGGGGASGESGQVKRNARYRGDYVWRVWVPEGTWRRLQTCKDICSPRPVTIPVFVEMLLALVGAAGAEVPRIDANVIDVSQDGDSTAPSIVLDMSVVEEVAVAQGGTLVENWNKVTKGEAGPTQVVGGSKSADEEKLTRNDSEEEEDEDALFEDDEFG
ncbi:hypothetical protein HDV05_000718 [Chytridiales sp. JEL 0842]|nr:hypothetical protein HDV05_000718 [Chytridiales sp. JEL 0842]